MKRLSNKAVGRMIERFRKLIPAFTCEPGCHACCGPVPATAWERARLPAVDSAKREACYDFSAQEDPAAVLKRISCPYLGETGCTAYAERPLVCRMFGTVPQLTCPKGCKPERRLSPIIEADILRFTQAVPHDLA